VGIWNTLLEKVVEIGNLATFKKYLNEHLKFHIIQGNGTSAAFKKKTGWHSLAFVK